MINRHFTTITDAAGEVYQHNEYFPYGETFVEERNAAEYTNYLFSGKELDSETGLYYFGARYYDARVGSWYGVDKLSDKYPSMSGFMYCAGNPINLIDPNGNELDDYKLNRNGDISLLAKTADNFDVLYATNGDGTVNSSRTTQVQLGILSNVNTIDNLPTTDSKNVRGTACVSELIIKGNDQADKLFDFIKDNSDVEFSQVQLGDESNYITTSGNQRNEVGMSYEIGTKASKANPTTRADHSHPDGSGFPSPADINIADKIHSIYSDVKFGIAIPGRKERVSFANGQNVVEFHSTIGQVNVYAKSGTPRILSPISNPVKTNMH